MLKKKPKEVALMFLTPLNFEVEPSWCKIYNVFPKRTVIPLHPKQYERRNENVSRVKTSTILTLLTTHPKKKKGRKRP